MTQELMPSERSLWVDRVAKEKQRADEQWFAGLRKAVETINRCDWLTLEQKEKLVGELYK